MSLYHKNRHISVTQETTDHVIHTLTLTCTPQTDNERRRSVRNFLLCFVAAIGTMSCTDSSVFSGIGFLEGVESMLVQLCTFEFVIQNFNKFQIALQRLCTCPAMVGGLSGRLSLRRQVATLLVVSKLIISDMLSRTRVVHQRAHHVYDTRSGVRAISCAA